MSRDKREPLRAEDATSWEEFQARYEAEVADGIRRYRSPKRWLWMLAAVACGFIDLALWVGGVVQGSSPGRWIALPFAVILVFPFIFFLAMSPAPGRPITKRQRELDAVRDDWKARADRGEIPMTTPGGPRVWQQQ
jgi:hypothetical protein